MLYRGAPVSDGVMDHSPPIKRVEGEEKTIRWIRSSRTVQQALRRAIDARTTRPVPDIRLPKEAMDDFQVQNGELIVLGNGSLSLVHAGIVILDAEQLEGCVPKSKTPKAAVSV